MGLRHLEPDQHPADCSDQRLVYSGSNVETNLDDTGIFQTVGAGAHYLAADSEYRDAGTTNINADLLADLKKMTTYPPTEFTNSLISESVTWSPQALRDTDTPDLGYHYPPLDYLLADVTVTNATVLVTNGAVIGVDAAATNWGLCLDNGALVLSEGTPSALNVFVRTHCVQELPWGNRTNGAPMFADVYPAPDVSPITKFRFTDFPMLNGTYLFNQNPDEGFVDPMIFRDSQIRGGYFQTSPGVSNVTMAVTNTLLERVNTTQNSSFPTVLELRNCLFEEGLLVLTNAAGSSWKATDNLFDKTSVTNGGGATLSSSYNGYVTNYSQLYPSSANDVILTNSTLDFVVGPLGDYYYPTNGGLLSTLIDAGSMNATNAGFYHYTTTTNQVMETNSVVDIGYHYLAVTNVDGVWLPIDSDGDGLSDGDEFYSYGTDPNDPDSDDDGMIDQPFAVWITRPDPTHDLP